MKASGQFGVPEVQQYMVSERGGPPLSHMFKLSSPRFQQLYHAQHSSFPPPPYLQQQKQAFGQHQQSQQDEQQHEEKHEKLVHGQDFPDDSSYPSPSPSSNYKRSVADQSVGEDHEELAEEGERGTQGNRWPRQETHALLKIRSEMDATFRDSNMKSALWEEMSSKMSEIGYSRSAKKCKEKFENVHKYYKRTKEGKSGKQDGKSYRFYTQLEALYGNANLSSPTVNKSGENLTSAAAAALDAGLSSQFLFPGAIPAETVKSKTEAGQRLELDHRTDLEFFSDSSEDDYGDPKECDTPESRKRKRKRLRLKLQFFETLMRRVLQKQEEMQQKFLEALEKREHERMMREEAWRRQEMVRISREHELRVQESSFAATRDAALISFLQKYIGQPLELPQMQIIPAKNVHSAPAFHEFQQKDHDVFDNSVKRWPKPEIHALIELRTGFDTKFHEPGPKNTVWEEISSKMCSLGYKRSAKRCKEKWENINKYFRKAKESNKSRSEDSKTCPYFHILDTLYSKGLLRQKQLGYRTEDRSEEVLDQPSEGNKDEESGQADGGDSDNLAFTTSGEHASNNSDLGLNISKMAPNIMNFASSGNAQSFSQNFDGVRIGNDASEMREKPVPVIAEGGYEKMEMEQAEKRIHGDRTAPLSTFMACVMEIPPNYSTSSIPQLQSECNV